MNALALAPLAIIVGAGVALLAWLIVQRTRHDSTAAELAVVRHQLEELARRLDTSFTASNSETRGGFEQYGERMRVLERELTTRIVALTEGQKQTNTIAEELRGLQRILTTPAQRGALGEYFLETALRNVLAPGTFTMQYTFPDRQLRADAVIFYDDKLIPIDAKFSLDNYNRFVRAETDVERDELSRAVQSDLKRRVDETAKYVRPDQGTLSFALMFIPSETLYYDFITRTVGAAGRERSLIDYAHERGVVPVSPVVLYAYLQTVLQGLRQVQFARGAAEIRTRVTELSAHLRSYDEYFRKLGVGLSNATSAYQHAQKEFEKIDKDVLRIARTDTEPAAVSATSATLDEA